MFDDLLEAVEHALCKRAVRWVANRHVGAGASIVDSSSDELRCRWTPSDAVADSDCNVTASASKPRVSEVVPDEESAEMMRRIPVMGRKFSAEIRTLPKEV